MPSRRISNFAPAFEGAIKNAVPLNEQKSCGGKGTALGLVSPRGYLVLGPDGSSQVRPHRELGAFIHGSDVGCDCAWGHAKRNDMDSAKRCRDQSAECLRLMKLAQSETEARVLRDLAHSWVRLANQIDRYTVLVKSNGPDRAKGMRRRRTRVAPRSEI
jgi:hypothetical protein